MEIWDRAAFDARLSIGDAIEALERALLSDLPTTPTRQHHSMPGGDLLVMPSYGDEGAGVKLVTVAPGNPERGLPLINGIYVLFDQTTLRVRALMDAAALTCIRTAAVSGVATKHLAREDASSLIVFGAGAQAAEHVEAMLAVRPVEKVVIVGRDPSRAGSLVDRLLVRGVVARTGSPGEVGEADIVCCCTTSTTPLFPGSLLRPSTHVNAVGSYKPDRRELDGETMRRARVVVESIDTAIQEAGDVVMAIHEGALNAEALSELDSVVKGKTLGSSGDITVFKSVGAGYQDLVVALAAAD